ncbi:MAG: tetratricopeptide repeat protein, partial [Longimicrobiales bacterium]
MSKPEVADIQRWSREVARDPGAPAFARLAAVYRRQGRRDAALRVCLRGLQRHPTHLDAHILLGKLYLEAGDRVKASVEWGMVLRLDPDNFDALRGLGFANLEQGDLDNAERLLRRAQEVRPGERTVAAALELLEQRRHQVESAAAAAWGRDGPGAAAGAAAGT